MPPSLERVVKRLTVLGSAKYKISGPEKAGSRRKTVHLVWKVGRRVRFAFFVYLKGDVHDAILSLEAAQAVWGCKVVLVCENQFRAVDARWVADECGLGNFRAVGFNELNARKLPGMIGLRYWLEI